MRRIKIEVSGYSCSIDLMTNGEYGVHSFVHSGVYGLCIEVTKTYKTLNGAINKALKVLNHRADIRDNENKL